MNSSSSRRGASHGRLGGGRVAGHLPADGAVGDGALGGGALGDGALGQGAVGQGAVGDRAVGQGAVGQGARGEGARGGGRRRLRDGLWGLTLAVLPWVGADPVTLLTGRDWGAGFQPAYLLLAAALLLSAPDWRRPGAESWDRAPARRGESLPRSRLAPWRWAMLAASAAVVLSAAGLWIAAPAGPELAARALRFLKQIIQLVVVASFAVFALMWTTSEERWRATLRWLALGLAFQLLYGLAQALAFPRPGAAFALCERFFTANPAILSGSPELYLGGGLTGIPRLRGTACEPLYLGNYLLAVLPLLWLWGGRWRAPLLAAGAVLLGLTWSRGAWLAAGGAGAVALALARRAGARRRLSRRVLAWALGGAGLAIALAAWLRPAPLLLPGQRLLQSLDTGDWSNLTRLYSMQAAARAFALSPLLGIGWGQFAFHFPALVDPQGLQSQFDWPVVNNYPLQVLCETGLVGGAVFAATAGLLARRVWAAAAPGASAGRRLGPGGRRRLVASAAAVAGVWGQLLTFSQYNLPHIWVALGLLLAALAPAEAGGPDPEAARG